MKYLRLHYKNKRSRITSNSNTDQLLLNQLRSLDIDYNNKIIASYHPTEYELSPCKIVNYIAQKYQSKVVYPIVHPILKRYMWFGDNLLKAYNKYGIIEPQFDALDVFSPWEIDIVFTPLVVFDKYKNRIGMGGGFYDQTFSFKKYLSQPLLIGLAFDEQQHSDTINSNSWDIALDIIITPTRIIQ